MKRKSFELDLEVMHIFSEVSGQFCTHSANYKERKGNGRITHQKDGRGEVGGSDSFVCQDPWNAAVW